MKKAFTLIELLIVVTVMATLMTIMFRLGAVSKDETARIKTITRLQKLENCLSGYFAAFGSYPPVKVYGSRDIFTVVENGVQTDESNDTLRWDQIEAACRSQPVDCAFPFREDMRETVDEFSERIRELAGSNEKYRQSSLYSAFSQGFSIGNPGDFTAYWDKTDWRDVQIFKFGLLSYLLPRYLVMMQGDPLYCGAGGGNPCAQWSENNDECVDATTGRNLTWKQVYKYVERNREGGRIKGSKADFIRVANMPSQAVCANWMANLEGICRLGHVMDDIYGINITSGGNLFDDPDEEAPPPTINLYSPGGKGGNWYMLDTISIVDGWYQEFYYYSPAGAQSYTLWSSGPNCRTFPPWIDKTGMLDKRVNEVRGGSNLTVADYISDDIIRMNH